MIFYVFAGMQWHVFSPKGVPLCRYPTRLEAALSALTFPGHKVRLYPTFTAHQLKPEDARALPYLLAQCCNPN